MKQRSRFADQFLQIHWPALYVPAPAESEDLIDEITRPFAGTADLVEIAGRSAVRREFPFRHLGIAEDRADDIVEVVRDTAGESADRLHAAALLQVYLQACTFLQEMITDHDIGEGVESHTQQAEFSRLRDGARPNYVEAEDFSTKAALSRARDACPAAQAGGGKDVFVRAGRQPVYARDMDDALRGRTKPGYQHRHPIRPAWRKGYPLSAPTMHPVQVA